MMLQARQGFALTDIFSYTIIQIKKRDGKYAEIYKKSGKKVWQVCDTGSDQLLCDILCGIHDHQSVSAGNLLQFSGA